MRTLMCIAAAAASVLATSPAAAQHAEQKALEAAVRALHRDSEAPIVVSARMVAPNVDGSVRIDEGNREALESHLGARISELEDAVTCEDMSRPESCSLDDGATVYQFFMPEPVKNGVLHLAVMLLKDGDSGRITREWWNVALVRESDVGWTVVDRQLQDTADGPW